MEMSADYMAETVEHMQRFGYSVTEAKDTNERDGQLVFNRTKYSCQSAEAELVLEVLCYADGREAYFMEIVRMGAMSSFSFPLDSWKFRPETVEFKYYVHPATGLGLSFLINLGNEQA